MSAQPGMDGLSLDQAPPLAIPFAFFVVAAVALVVAGGLLVSRGGGALMTPWQPDTLVLTHLVTLGFLGSVMFGALYQMTPVVAVAPVPWIRHAYAVLGLNVLGLALLVQWGGAGVRADLGSPWLGFHFLATGVMLFCGLVGWALLRSRTPGPTVWGLRAAVSSLFLAMSLGTLLVGAWSGGSLLASSRTTALQLHLGLALVGWIGGLLTAVSWQVLPMFYLTPGVAPARSWLVLLALAASTAGAALVIVLESAGQLAGAGGTVGLVLLAPGALALWVVHPTLVLLDLSRRRRRRVDVSARAWQAAMALGPVCLVLACGAVLVGSERLAMAFAWCTLVGWAGLVVHGMLTRIAPFLVWWHRFSPLVGTVPVPAMGRLLSARLVSFGLVVHGAVVVVGLLAIVVGGDALARITGGGLVLLGGVLLSHLVTLLRLRPTASDPIGRVAGAEAPELEVGAA